MECAHFLTTGHRAERFHMGIGYSFHPLEESTFESIENQGAYAPFEAQ